MVPIQVAEVLGNSFDQFATTVSDDLRQQIREERDAVNLGEG
jgi:hypothetical protein